MNFKLLFIVCFLLFQYVGNTQNKNTEERLTPNQAFSFQDFKSPSIKYAPYTRWWWPGNDVTPEELKREINLFANNGFGGVEIQPLSLGIPLSGEVLSWDSPNYYKNIRVVLDEARKTGLTVDLTNGSGWPPGGPHLNPEDGFLSLNHTDTVATGPQPIKIKLPEPETTEGGKPGLQAVIAAEILPKAEGDNTITTPLNASSIQNLTDFVDNNILLWDAPEGTWDIIAFWSGPSGEKTMLMAKPGQAPVVDHLDSAKVLKNYKHLLGERTGLTPYFGNTLRSIFNDSYEFKADRHYSTDFFAWFKKNRGYDITPWLPANMQKGYNMVEYLNPHADPYFSFSEEDWRLRYDYDLSIGELLGEHFLKTSLNYMEAKGLLHRTQTYGLNMDMMALAGMASIPETESMLGSEGKIKIVVSGANLYNRPVISAESVVYINRAYTTTPQMVKLAVDKLFAAGVNQVIYHGTPYRYFNEKIGGEGWYPFSTTFIPYVNFASNLGESNPYWKSQKEINKYVARVQYALRTGKPVIDVLVYFPFLNFDGINANPEEIFTLGYIENTHPGSKEKFKDPQAKLIHEWILKTWPLINALEKNGLTWGWVNDVSIQAAELTPGKQINIRGNRYKGLIVANAPYMQTKTARQINHLASNGLNLLIAGKAPEKQPSFLNWYENDIKTKKYIEKALANHSTHFIREASECEKWVKNIKARCPVKFKDDYSFTRQAQRELPDGSRIHFIWNKSSQWQTTSLLLNNKFKQSYWLNAEDGTIIGNGINKEARHTIPPYSSVILYASTQKTAIKNTKHIAGLNPTEATKILSIGLWDINTDSLHIKNSPLFNWKSKESWKYQSATGIYTANFQIETVNSRKNYLLDLGEVYHTAEVSINGKTLGPRLYQPFIFDISNYIKSGNNSIEIKVTPTLLNEFIGKANSGDIKYRQFKGKEDELMNEGLVGPVVIYSK